MDAIILGASLVSFLALAVSWLTLPSGITTDEMPSRVSVQRRTAAEA
jgi:hypothetical protein